MTDKALPVQTTDIILMIEIKFSSTSHTRWKINHFAGVSKCEIPKLMTDSGVT